MNATVKKIVIGTRSVGEGYPCLIIAEAGVNHNGDAGMARMLVDAAADAGADAVKFQTFRTEALVTRDAPKADYQQTTTDRSESQFDMLKRLELSPDLHRELKAQCERRGMLFLSTPFEEASADFLDSLPVVAFKLPSGELTNLPFLAHVARKGRPLIVSTGMGDMDEVVAAVEAVQANGNPPICLLHCVSQYPAPAADANLRAMRSLSDRFHVPVGFSDHTEGWDITLAAVTMGACVVEKHFTLDRKLPGPDHLASLEPHELQAMVQSIRRVESALGDGIKCPKSSESNTAAVARKSLIAACALPAGTLIEHGHVVIRRPGTGLPPSELPAIIGKALRRSVRAGELFRKDMFP